MTLTASDPAVRAVVNVTFRPDDTLAIWVPQQMEQCYKEARSIDEIMAKATYTVVRRLHVTTTEKIGQPPGASPFYNHDLRWVLMPSPVRLRTSIGD